MNSLSLLRGMRKVTATMAVAGAVALAPSTASALDPAKVPSIGADAGRFTLPIQCDITMPNLLGDLTVATIPGDVDIEGIAPVQLGPGQDFYLSQGKGALTLPGWLTSLGGLFAVNRADANVDNLLIGATRSTPEVINLSDLYDLSVQDVPVEPGEPITVGLPDAGDFLVGPYSAPQDGRTQFRFKGATADVTLKTKWNFKIRVRAHCVATEGEQLLSVAVGDEIDPSVPALLEGEPLDFPKAPSGGVIGIVNAPYQCSIDGKQYDFGIAVGAEFPLAVPRDGTFTFEQASGALTVPAQTVNRLMDAGINTVEGVVDDLRLSIDNGSPASPGVLPEAGTEFPMTTLQYNTPVIVPLPVNGTLTAGPYTPDAGAESMIIGLGKAAASLQFNGSGETVQVDCPKPEPDALLVDAAIY